jgi:hypothetical protein
MAACSWVLTPLSNPTLRDHSLDALMWINQRVIHLRSATMRRRCKSARRPGILLLVSEFAGHYPR